jgi:hypothetical protein
MASTYPFSFPTHIVAIWYGTVPFRKEALRICSIYLTLLVIVRTIVFPRIAQHDNDMRELEIVTNVTCSCGVQWFGCRMEGAIALYRRRFRAAARGRRLQPVTARHIDVCCTIPHLLVYLFWSPTSRTDSSLELAFPIPYSAEATRNHAHNDANL